jgi:cobalt transporter subunit CbtB
MQAPTALHTAGTRVWTIAVPWFALELLVFGLVVLFVVGFSTLPLAHTAAHDTRHAIGFPCH